ncbi:hypothetical protein TIFTF001_029897 [Ficus carica]|uniref:Uncharacterized protein n=1 Tax=Ficus carica TaxID=3494 RepID=A0AA88DWL6_FICCA|nr:hypothetical protein TIFTF001_029897 [Ficus carica]
MKNTEGGQSLAPECLTELEMNGNSGRNEEGWKELGWKRVLRIADSFASSAPIASRLQSTSAWPLSYVSLSLSLSISSEFLSPALFRSLRLDFAYFRPNFDLFSEF